MNRTTALAARQQEFAQWLLHRHPGRTPVVGASPPASTAARLRVYTEGYRTRLVEVLGNDFPVLRASLGARRFEALAGAYLAAHPSRHPSVRHLGDRFARWLQVVDVGNAVPADLARLEWRQGEVFDAIDAPACGIEALAALAPDAWLRLRLVLHPAVRRLRLRSNAIDVMRAHASGSRLPALHARPASAWVLWRTAFDVHWRRLARDEAMALAAVARGDAFADWCVRLSGENPALRAASLLKRWLADGLVAGLSSTP